MGGAAGASARGPAGVDNEIEERCLRRLPNSFLARNRESRGTLLGILETNVWTVALAALVTVLATGLGAVSSWFVKSVSRWRLRISNAIPAGLMLGASHSLPHREG